MRNPYRFCQKPFEQLYSSPFDIKKLTVPAMLYSSAAFICVRRCVYLYIFISVRLYLFICIYVLVYVCMSVCVFVCFRYHVMVK